MTEEGKKTCQPSPLLEPVKKLLEKNLNGMLPLWLSFYASILIKYDLRYC